MRRGQFVVVATSGDYGKPRPALIVQSELFAELPSVVICPLTTTLRNDADQFRLEVEALQVRGPAGHAEVNDPLCLHGQLRWIDRARPASAGGRRS